MARIPSATKAQLRRQFLPEDSADDFAKATSLQELDQRVAHRLIDAEDDLAAVGARVDALVIPTEAQIIAAADASASAAVGALPPIPSESDVQGWIGDYLGLNLADLVEAEIDIALPVLAPALGTLEVVTGVDFGASSVTTKTLTFGSRGQVTGVA